MICFIYASQYGYTTQLVTQLHSELDQTTKDSIRLLNAGSLQKADFYNSCAGFVYFTSTFYQGRSPENGVEFLDQLINDGIAKYQLRNKKYAIFGVGDSEFYHYQGAAEYADKVFLDREAVRVCDMYQHDRQVDAAAQSESARQWLQNAIQRLLE